MARPAPEVTMVNVPDTHNLHMCPGILDPVLQQYAALPPNVSHATCDKSKYYLHVTFSRCGERMTSQTSIRAHACQMFLQDANSEVCTACEESKQLVMKKHKRKLISKNIQKTGKNQE